MDLSLSLSLKIIRYCGRYNIYKYYESKLTSWVFIFGALAFLFNPLFPIFMDKSVWVGIDLISAIVFFFSAYSVKGNDEKI